MKYLKQLTIILFVTGIGELLHFLIPLPVPASIYGMVLMLVLLMTHIVKVEQVNETADFLIEIMPVMFIPAGVGLMTTFDVLRPILLPVSVILVVTTFIVMVVTGKVSDRMIEREKAAGQRENAGERRRKVSGQEESVGKKRAMEVTDK